MCKFDDIKQQFVKYVLDKANLYSDVFSTPYYEDSRVYVETFEAQYIMTTVKNQTVDYTLSTATVKPPLFFIISTISITYQ